MIFIEQDARRLLMERLDESIKSHADMLDAGNIGSIYDLQELSEIHYYLKAEHEFTPAEVEALLSFQDPLDVARWCWEENTHEHSFPICDIMREIDAYKRFEPSAGRAAVEERYSQFREALAGNFFGYRKELLSWDREKLIDHAGEIAKATDTFWALMGDYAPVMEEMDFFLQFDDPLREISRFGPFDDINAAMRALYDSREELMGEISGAPPTEHGDPAASVRERLKAAMEEVKGHAAPGRPAHDPGAR